MREVLTPEEVEQIREQARNPNIFTLRQVAAQWELDVGHVRFIANRKSR